MRGCCKSNIIDGYRIERIYTQSCAERWRRLHQQLPDDVADSVCVHHRTGGHIAGTWDSGDSLPVISPTPSLIRREAGAFLRTATHDTHAISDVVSRHHWLVSLTFVCETVPPPPETFYQSSCVASHADSGHPGSSTAIPHKSPPNTRNWPRGHGR